MRCNKFTFDQHGLGALLAGVFLMPCLTGCAPSLIIPSTPSARVVGYHQMMADAGINYLTYDVNGTEIEKWAPPVQERKVQKYYLTTVPGLENNLAFGLLDPSLEFGLGIQFFQATRFSAKYQWLGREDPRSKASAILSEIAVSTRSAAASIGGVASGYLGSVDVSLGGRAGYSTLFGIADGSSFDGQADTLPNSVYLNMPEIYYTREKKPSWIEPGSHGYYDIYLTAGIWDMIGGFAVRIFSPHEYSYPAGTNYRLPSHWNFSPLLSASIKYQFHAAKMNLEGSLWDWIKQSPSKIGRVFYTPRKKVAE